MEEAQIRGIMEVPSQTSSELLNALSPMLQQTPTAMRGSNSFIFCTKAVPGHHPRLLMNADVTSPQDITPGYS